MATYKENQDFAKEIIDVNSVLDNAIDYISSHLSPDDVFDYRRLLDWAEDNGFVKKEE